MTGKRRLVSRVGDRDVQISTREANDDRLWGRARSTTGEQYQSKKEQDLHWSSLSSLGRTEALSNSTVKFLTFSGVVTVVGA